MVSSFFFIVALFVASPIKQAIPFSWLLIFLELEDLRGFFQPFRHPQFDNGLAGHP